MPADMIISVKKGKTISEISQLRKDRSDEGAHS